MADFVYEVARFELPDEPCDGVAQLGIVGHVGLPHCRPSRSSRAFGSGMVGDLVLCAVGLSIEPWFRQWETLKGHTSVPFNWTIASLFSAVFANALIACSGSYIIGIMGWAFMG